MRYYIVAGEASGDLHASNLIKAIRQIDPAAAFRECRVLAVNKELGILLVDIGFRQGAFVGLVLRGGGDKKIEIRLEDVRSGVSAAAVMRGTLNDVTPGMVFNAETRVKR